MKDVSTDHRFAVENMLVERFLLGELSADALSSFELHLFECSACVELVKAGQEFKQALSAPSVYGPPRRSLFMELWLRLWSGVKSSWGSMRKPALLLLLPGPVPRPLPAELKISPVMFRLYAVAFLLLAVVSGLKVFALALRKERGAR